MAIRSVMMPLFPTEVRQCQSQAAEFVFSLLGEIQPKII
jgi:hypothetical protein